MHPQPLIRKDGKLWTVPDHDITSVAWIWLDPLDPVDATRLESIYTATIDFTSDTAQFKPCVSEVLDQVPAQIINSAYGFEVTGASISGVGTFTATVTFYRVRG